MTISRDFKQTVGERALRDSAFAASLRDEALALDLKGAPEALQNMLRELAGTEAARAPAKRPDESGS